LSKCSVKMNEELYQSATPTAAHPILWDGKNFLVMEDSPISAENKELSFDNNLVSDGNMIYFCSPSLTITLKDQDASRMACQGDGGIDTMMVYSIIVGDFVPREERIIQTGVDGNRQELSIKHSMTKPPSP